MRIVYCGMLVNLALAFAISACNHSESGGFAGMDPVEPGSPDARDAAFEKEILAIKARLKEPRKFEPALREASIRYGYYVPPLEPQPVGVVSPEGMPALEKRADFAYTSAQVKGFNIIYHFAHFRIVTVPPNYTLEATANRVSGGTDPILVGFYKTNGTSQPDAYQIQIVGYNDDQSATSRNSRFVWKNTTGSPKSVRLVSFAMPGTAGKSSLTHKVSLGTFTVSSQSKTMWVSGTFLFESSEPPHVQSCIGPLRTSIRLQMGTRPSRTHFGHTLLAVNANTWRGGYIRDIDYTLPLQDVLPSGGYNLLLGYFEGDGYQPDPMTTEALNQHYQYPLFHGYQFDDYYCD